MSKLYLYHTDLYYYKLYMNYCCIIVAVVCDETASMNSDAGRTLAVVLGTVAGVIVIVLVVFVVWYVARRWPWIAGHHRRARILRAEVAMDGDNVRPTTFRILPRHGLLHTKPFRPLSDHLQAPSAPEQSVIGLTELETAYDQPTWVGHLHSSITARYQ